MVSGSSEVRSTGAEAPLALAALRASGQLVAEDPRPRCLEQTHEFVDIFELDLK
jgi:hypothetical protein